MKAIYIAILICLLGSWASADVLKDFDSLGGNDVLMERAQKLQPDKRVSIVQKRLIDRRWRHEFTGGYSNILGGDAYLQTQSLDFSYYLHINPYIAVGLNYYSAFSELSKEGRFLIDQDKLIPDVDAIQEGREVVVNFFPMYGKMNLLNLGLIHFDFYGLASYGDINLASGSTDAYSVGAGIGIWVSQYITSRLELKQRYFQAQRFDTSVDMAMTSASFSLGVLL